MKEVKDAENDEYVDTSIDFVDDNGIEKSTKRTFNRVKRQQNNYSGKFNLQSLERARCVGTIAF